MRNRVALMSCLAAGMLLPAWVPSVARATTLTSEGGFTFDFQDGAGGAFSSDGSMSDGLSDAYDGCYRLSIDGATYDAGRGGTPSTTSLGGRQIEMPEATVGVLTARRLMYVPTTGGNYGRYLDVITNPTASSVTATLSIDGNLGSDGGTSVFATSSGDTTVSADDAWATTDDRDGSGDPSLGHVIQGTDPPTRASSATIVSDQVDWSWTVTIPAGGRVVLLTYAIMERNQMAAQAEARRLSEAPDDAMVGLDEYLDDIINFSIAVAGAPRVRFDGPFSAAEGEAAVLTVAVMDPEGDASTWSWDLDGDGTFGEMPGGTSYTVPAGSTDGPGEVRVGLEASDGTNTVQRYRTLSITNVDPIVTNVPSSTVASVGALWRWDIEVTDPGGSLDPLGYTVLRGPSDMTVTAAGQVQWTPDDLDVTVGSETVAVTIVVNDGDEGSDEVSFELTVSPNRAPESPTLLYPAAGLVIATPAPRLVVTSVSDPDLDTLTYFFEIADEETFAAPLHASGPVEQTAGYTAWTVPTALSPGRYYWRAWVSDGTVQTEPRSTNYLLVRDPALVDAGGPVEADGGMPMVEVDAGTPVVTPTSSGCAVAIPSTGGSPAGLALFGLAALALVLRRRR